ncbi:AAA family ATPase [Desulfovibrio piger]|uniref:AAA family ATPase n=1 Tax=Desulfovibrio piger TaxID=901 RepID=UPI0026EBD06B|nr:AAA family ATPase [Desulfovibrio piger]
MSTVKEVKERFKTPQSLDQLASNIREVFQATPVEKHNVPEVLLLFAYNGTGKTRLSMEFTRQGTVNDKSDTLYFNAFTEDLFFWDNDLENDEHRVLKLNSDSRFFSGVYGMEMETRIRSFLHRYTNFDFSIDTETWEISFSCGEQENEETNIKISRGEERLFIWCFFLAILQLVLDDDDAYSWVKYVYIDDPISSLDDNNVVSMACNFSKMFKERNNKEIKLIISTHHALFYNILHNEFSERKIHLPYFYSINKDGYTLTYSNDSPFLHHLALLKDLKDAADTGNLYTFHFNMLRVILEKTAQFHGFKKFSDCLGDAKTEEEVQENARLINLMSHGNYSLFEPREMVPDNKEHFKNALNRFLARYPFKLDAFNQN